MNYYLMDPEFAFSSSPFAGAGAGLRKARAHHANTLKLALAENYGRVEVRDQGTDKALAKTYVKVYARLRNGTVRFFKDGYTDLRGRFDYASVNSPERQAIQKFSVLILSEDRGAVIREVAPPQQ